MTKKTKRVGKRVRKSDKVVISQILKENSKGISRHDIRKILADNVRGLLVQTNTSQVELAKVCGVGQQCISLYVCKKNPKGFPLRTIVKIAAYFECSIADLGTPGKFQCRGVTDLRRRSRPNGLVISDLHPKCEWSRPVDVRFIAAKNIRGLIDQKGIDPTQLANAIGLSRTCVLTYLAIGGVKFFSTVTLCDVAKYFQCSWADLVTPDRFPYNGRTDMRTKDQSAA